MLVVQYLENAHSITEITPSDVCARLRAAFDLLPISCVLLGWSVSPALMDACSEEAARAGAQIFRWHPLLTGDGTFMPLIEWQTIGLDGCPVQGFQGMPEFTFVCPNRPAVREASLSHLYDVIQGGDYEGVFLDRIRFPSPAADPARFLACFCDDCCRAAADEGLDLKATRRHIQALLAMPERTSSFIQCLLDSGILETSDPNVIALRKFLDFRAHSVTRFVQAATDLIHAEGLIVGLDCFSPSLTSIVGQDMAALTPYCEWIKIMSYAHTLGPAGLPFELLGLIDWLVAQRSVGEPTALAWLSRATCLALPSTRAALRQKGLSSESLGAEVKRSRDAGVDTLLAGIELVEMEGVTNLGRAQIEADLKAFLAAGADGLVLSWDLWHIPLQWLELVRAIPFSSNQTVVS